MGIYEIPATEYHLEIPSTEYHLDPCPEPSLSASVARTLIDRSPLHAWMQHPKLGGQQEESQPARMSLGSAAHSVILEGDWNSIMFIVADSFRTKAAQARRDQIIRLKGLRCWKKTAARLRGWLPHFAVLGSIGAGWKRNAP